jgi:hypothetical protein
MQRKIKCGPSKLMQTCKLVLANSTPESPDSQFVAFMPKKEMSLKDLRP